MKNIEFKPAKKAAETKKIRVAAYCRTSGDSDEAQHSLETQKKHFKDYIEGQKDWILVDIYADNAVSGTLYERPEFQRMLKDCRDGEIDLVITKSITRFARNTLVTLKTLRELKVLGIRCIFENEHLDTDTEIGEFLFTVFAVNAESTSESASENQKWRIEKLYEQGKVAGGRYMGYRIKDSALVVEPKEASIIKDIYELYLSGKGYGRIAEYLNRKKIPASYGGCWSPSTIRGILTNEIYIGNLVLQKMFREDFRTKKLVRNNGQKKMFKVEKVHEAIIDKKTFQAVQDEIKRRGEKQKLIMQDKKREERLFTGMIQCQQCGSSFIRKRPNRGRNKPFWVCGKYFKQGKVACPSQKISEEILIKETRRALMVIDLTPELIKERIEKIYVPGKFSLVFLLKDGTEIHAMWRYMRQSKKDNKKSKIYKGE